MKQLTVISGKGGTGKTVLTASFASLARELGRAVLVDADVDAPNLHLLVHGQMRESDRFRGMKLAEIDLSRVPGGRGYDDLCPFEAIRGFAVDPLRCVGCGVCVVAAPEGVFRLVEREAGEILIEESAYGPFLRARLFAGEPGFGGLVYALRSRAEETAMKEGAGLVLIDGSPGIGCPVLASLSGCDLALIVAEPSLSGLHDFERVLDLARSIGVVAAACVNRSDINAPILSKIRGLCGRMGVPYLGSVPYDEAVLESLDKGKPVVETGDGPAARAIRAIWKETSALLGRGGQS